MLILNLLIKENIFLKATSSAATQQSSGDADLYNKVTQQGDKVRQLKSDKADKVC